MSIESYINSKIEKASWRSIGAGLTGLPSLWTGNLAKKLVREDDSAKVKTVKFLLGMGLTAFLLTQAPIGFALIGGKTLLALPFASNALSFLLTKPRPAADQDHRDTREKVVEGRYS
ncbi:MAG: hypothetical protein IT384_31585 [Deltaproteobacteria bacterium]|nr:hypothetical protein [Deltaproteobacteria bacterium]